MIDTVFDYDHSGHPRIERNGFVFHHTDNRAIESALGRALWLWSVRPREFRNIAVTCMRADYSWARPGQEYLEIYQHIRHERIGQLSPEPLGSWPGGTERDPEALSGSA